MELQELKLEHGSHASREDGVCAMEAVAWLAGEQHSDTPPCACPVLTIYITKLNDRWNDKERQLLRPFLQRVIGTRDGKSLERANILAFRAGNVFAPIAMEIWGRKDLADEMRAVPFGDWDGQRKVCRKAAFAAAAAAEDAFAATFAAAAEAAFAAAATFAAEAATFAAAAEAATFAAEAATFAAAAEAATFAAAEAATFAAAAEAATFAAAIFAAKSRRPEIIQESLKVLEEMLSC